MRRRTAVWRVDERGVNLPVTGDTRQAERGGGAQRVRLIVLANPGSYYGRDLERAARERGHAVWVIPFAGLGAAVRNESPAFFGPEPVEGGVEQSRPPLDGADAILVRTMPPGSLEQVIFRMNLLSRLEAAGVSVFNSPRALECAVDKYLTTARLAAAGLPTPATDVCETADGALAAFERLGGDVVVKPLFGSEGRGIVRVSDPDTALRVFRALERIDAVLYVQQFVAHAGYDVRVLVLDGRVLGSMRRCNTSDFRTNISRRARGEPHAITPLEEEWALRAAAVTGARMAGIDLLYGRDGAGYVIEVNAVPGWKALREVTGVDVAAAAVAALEASW